MMMCDRNAPGRCPIWPAQNFASRVFVTAAPIVIVAATSELCTHRDATSQFATSPTHHNSGDDLTWIAYAGFCTRELGQEQGTNYPFSSPMSSLRNHLLRAAGSPAAILKIAWCETPAMLRTQANNVIRAWTLRLTQCVVASPRNNVLRRFEELRQSQSADSVTQNRSRCVTRICTRYRNSQLSKSFRVLSL